MTLHEIQDKIARVDKIIQSAYGFRAKLMEEYMRLIREQAAEEEADIRAELETRLASHR